MKHKVPWCGCMAYPPEYLYQTLGLIRLSELKRNVPWAKARPSPSGDGAP